MLIGDLFQESRDLVDASSASYPDTQLLRRMNTAMEDVVGDLINADGTWQFDDTNYTDLPIGVADLVDGQSGYTFDNTFLEIENVKVKNPGGVFLLLDQWDQSSDRIAIEVYQNLKGIPTMYDKEANTISLLPNVSASSVTLTGGLKVQFKRTAKLWTSGDISAGTVSPGFASPYHILLAYKAALPYALSYKKDRVALIQGEIMRLHKALITHYGSREKDRRKAMSSKGISFR